MTKLFVRDSDGSRSYGLFAPFLRHLALPAFATVAALSATPAHAAVQLYYAETYEYDDAGGQVGANGYTPITSFGSRAWTTRGEVDTQFSFYGGYLINTSYSVQPSGITWDVTGQQWGNGESVTNYRELTLLFLSSRPLHVTSSETQSLGFIGNCPQCVVNMGASVSDSYYNLSENAWETSVFVAFSANAPFPFEGDFDDYFRHQVDFTHSFSATISEVPEPTTWAMLLIGFGAIGSVVRRRRPRAVPEPARA